MRELRSTPGIVCEVADLGIDGTIMTSCLLLHFPFRSKSFPIPIENKMALNNY